MAFSVKIRLAHEMDIPKMVEMGKKFHAITDYGFIPYDQDTAARLFLTSISHQLCAVACNEDEVVGMLGGIKVPCLLNENVMVGTELAWWVEPEFRGGSAAIRMLDFIETQAKEAGLAFWSMMCLEASKPDGLEALYMKRSYQRAERTFVRIL
jgi:hypothetical protein